MELHTHPSHLPARKGGRWKEWDTRKGENVKLNREYDREGFCLEAPPDWVAALEFTAALRLGGTNAVG